MRIKKRVLQKIFSVFASTLLLINSFTPYLLIAPIVNQVKAQEETVTPEPTSVPTIETVISTPTVEVTPTIEETPVETVAPTELPTLEPTEAPSVPAPPVEEGQILDGISTTVTPTITAVQPEEGQLQAVILENVEAQSLNLDSVDPSNSATLTTDKADYAPTDTAIISGSLLTPDTNYSLTISSTDEPATTTTVEVTTNADGTFIYAYQLDGNYRPNYLVVLKDQSGNIVATTTFTDAPANRNWSGAVSTDWNNAGNWDTLPSSGDNAIISSGKPRYPVINNTVSINAVTVNSGGSVSVSTGGTFTMGGTMTMNGTYTQTDGTVSMGNNNFNALTSGASFSVSGGSLTTTSKLDVSTAGVSASQTGGTINVKDFDATGNTFNQSGSGSLLKISHDTKGGFNSTGGTVEFTGNSGGGAFPAGTYQFFNVIIDSGVDPGFNNAANTIKVAGTWTNNNSSLSLTGTTVEFNGSSLQTINGATTFTTLKINGSGATLGGSVNQTVNTSLNLTSGNITTGSNTLIIASGGSVSRTSGHVDGNLQMPIPTGSPTLTFHIGTGLNYTPISVAITSITTGGGADDILTAKSTATEHPSISTSGIDATKDVNRYWTLTKAGTWGFTSYSPTFNFVVGDIDAGANTANFVVKKFNSPSTWTSTTVGTRTGTSTQATGVASFSDFAVGELDTTAPTVTSATASPDPAKAGTVTVTVNFSETMKTSTSPTVQITGITGSPITVTQSSYLGTTWTGTFTLVNNEDTTATIAVSGAQDLAGNTMVTNNTAGTFAVDTVSPVINFTNDVAAGPVQSDDINIAVTEAHPDSYSYGFSSDATCDGTDTYPNSFTSGTPFTISEETNNGKYICAKATDTAGNISYQVSANALNIDATVPTISSVNTAHADGFFKAGEVIDLTVDYSEIVNVTGTPTLALNSGGTASYLSGSGTSTLTFRYTVGTGDTSLDLTYTGTLALSLTGGSTIKDSAENDADNTLPDPTTFAAAHAIVIDTTEPSSTPQTPVSGYYNAASWPSEITGTASDDNSVAQVEVSIYDGSDYWNGVNWSGPQTWFVTTGTTSWSYSFTPNKDVELTISSRATDNAGNVESTGVLSGVFYDTTAPTGGSISYPDGYNTTTSVDLTVDDGDGSIAGIDTATRTVQRQDATLTSGVCNGFGVFGTISPSGSYPNFTDATVSNGNCYKYEYLISDNASNQATYTSTNIVIVDTVAPDEPVATPGASDSQTDLSVTLASSDSGSGLAAIYYTTDGSPPATSGTRVLYPLDNSVPIVVDHDLTLKAIAYDNAGNTSTVLSAVYGIAPVISSQTSNLVGTTSTTITWTTDDLSTSRVIYDTVSHPVLGTAPNYDYANSTVEDSTKVISHSVGVTGLTAGTTYYYRTVSHGSPETVGAENNFKTDTSNGGGGGGTVAGATAPVCNDTKPGSAPVLLSAVAGANSVTLTWAKATDPVSYYLMTFGTSSGAQTYGNPNIGGSDTISYTVTGLSGGATYYFKVRAGNGCTPGDFSNELSARPTGGFIAGVPAGFAPGVLGEATSAAELTPTIVNVSPTSPVSAVLGQVQGLMTKKNNWKYLLLLIPLILLILYFWRKRSA